MNTLTNDFNDRGQGANGSLINQHNNQHNDQHSKQNSNQHSNQQNHDNDDYNDDDDLIPSYNEGYRVSLTKITNQKNLWDNALTDIHNDIHSDIHNDINNHYDNNALTHPEHTGSPVDFFNNLGNSIAKTWHNITHYSDHEPNHDGLNNNNIPVVYHRLTNYVDYLMEHRGQVDLNVAQIKSQSISNEINQIHNQNLHNVLVRVNINPDCLEQPRNSDSHDKIMHMLQLCQQYSSPDLQALWATMIKLEIKNPDTISRRLMHLVEQLDSKTMQAIVAIFTEVLLIHNQVSDTQQQEQYVISNNTANHDNINTMLNYGLLNQNSHVNLPQTICDTGQHDFREIYYPCCKDTIMVNILHIIDQDRAIESSSNIHVSYTLNPVAIELYKILDQYYHFKNDQYYIKLHQYLLKNLRHHENNCQLHHDRDMVVARLKVNHLNQGQSNNTNNDNQSINFNQYIIQAPVQLRGINLKTYLNHREYELCLQNTCNNNYDRV